MLNLKNQYFVGKFISTTNMNFRYFSDKVDDCAFAGGVFYFGSLKTSFVVKIDKNDNMLNIQTKNSVYNIQIESGEILDLSNGTIYIKEDINTNK